MTFKEKLSRAWQRQNSLLCVGLDPDPQRIPRSISGPRRLFEFNREIIDATARWSCAFKPQIAYYAALGAEDQLQQTIDYIRSHYSDIPIILDAKRGDIGSTATMYAREAFERYNADAVTVNPYMGGDTLKPFLEWADRGVIILCRTSNPGSGDIQQLDVGGGTSVALRVAQLAATDWNDNQNVGLVVGATWPAEIRAVRDIVADMPLLIPGVGAQGGDLRAVLDAGLDTGGAGIIINASRSILYAAGGNNFADASAEEAQAVCARINTLRKKN